MNVPLKSYRGARISVGSQFGLERGRKLQCGHVSVENGTGKGETDAELRQVHHRRALRVITLVCSRVDACTSSLSSTFPDVPGFEYLPPCTT